MVSLGMGHVRGTEWFHGMTCSGCGTVSSAGDRMLRGTLRALGVFLLVPTLATVFAVLAGMESAQQTIPLFVVAWVLLGVPAAAVTLREGFRWACPHCGATELFASDEPVSAPRR